MRLEFPDSISRKQWNIKLYENPSSWNEFFHADRRKNGRKAIRMDMTKLIFAFRNTANAPKNGNCVLIWKKINYSKEKIYM